MQTKQIEEFDVDGTNYVCTIVGATTGPHRRWAFLAEMEGLVTNVVLPVHVDICPTVSIDVRVAGDATSGVRHSLAELNAGAVHGAPCNGNEHVLSMLDPVHDDGIEAWLALDKRLKKEAGTVAPPVCTTEPWVRADEEAKKVAAVNDAKPSSLN